MDDIVENLRGHVLRCSHRKLCQVMELERRTIVYKFYFLQLTLLPLFIVTQENILSLQV